METPRFEHWGALPVHSRRAMVATADAHATDAAVEVLREGGNVVDATIAAAMVLCVTQPGMCGIGGGGHLLARFAGGRMLCLDFREQAPRAASRNMFEGLAPDASRIGWLAAAVPGTMKGLGEAHRRAGSLSWARLIAPAIALAESGHEVTYLRSRMLATCSALYRDPGDVWRQPELAHTLFRIARAGPEEFYCGETAERLASEMAAHDGLIDRSDLEAYTCEDRAPLSREFRGREVWTMPPSSAGGIGLLRILEILDGTPFADEGPGAATFFHYLVEAMRRSFAERAGRSQSCPTQLAEGSCTTHVSVLDCHGNAAALTFTLNSMYGSGVMVPGLGFLLNNNMDNFSVRPGTANQYGLVQGEANAIAPGKRPASSMTPTIVCKDGETEIVLGTPGGPTIVTAVAQALLYMIEFGWNPQDAVNTPRIHHQWLPDVIYAERGVSPDAVRGLEARGHCVEYKASINDMNAIVWRDGWLQGAVDCRREGRAAGI